MLDCGVSEAYIERDGKPHKLGVIFLPLQNGKVLLERRIKPDNSFFGYTIIPGGKIECDSNGNPEDPQKTVKRELREEYDLDASEIIYLDTFTDFVLSNRPYEFHAYLVKCAGVAQDKEPEKSRHFWATPAEADKELIIASNRNVLARAMRVIEGL